MISVAGRQASHMSERFSNFLKALVCEADAKDRLKRSTFFWVYCSHFKVTRAVAKQALPVLEDMAVLKNGHHFIEVRS